MPLRRTIENLVIHEGAERVFEWYWNDNGEMPGLDAFERMTAANQIEFLARLEAWGNLRLGDRLSPSQLNVELGDPLILAIKVGKLRYPVFHADGSNAWIVCGPPYAKQSQRRDKRGDRAIERALRQHQDYHRAVKGLHYYDRDK